MTTLQDLVSERALRLKDLGPKPTMTLINTGRRLPGPKALARMSTVLRLPAPQVMAACRETQRRAMVARALAARVVGKAHRSGSCAQPTGRAVRKAGRS